MNQQLNNLLEVGEIILEDGISGHHILFLSIIGEIEGHNLSSERIKTTKYEHLLPILAKAQDSEEIEGIFFLINTVGGDCSCGLAVAEMIASIKKPTVSLIIGDSHSIGVPLSVAADRTFIAPTATMVLHPVRLNGTIIGAPHNSCRRNGSKRGIDSRGWRYLRSTFLVASGDRKKKEKKKL